MITAANVLARIDSGTEKKQFYCELKKRNVNTGKGNHHGSIDDMRDACPNDDLSSQQLVRKKALAPSQRKYINFIFDHHNFCFHAEEDFGFQTFTTFCTSEFWPLL